MATGTCLLTFLFLLVVFVPDILGANVAFKKDAVASATCGFPRELFYVVTERYKTPRYRNASYCDGTDPSKSHNATNLVDDNFSTWWQSPASVDKVSITIDLQGVYQKYFYANKVEIRFGQYYRPGQLAFYKSSDSGLSYQRWHFFVSSHDDCQEKFGVPVTINPASVSAVLCMPYTAEAMEQNDVVSLLVVGPRGDVNNPSDELLEWMNVTNIQLNFMSLRRIFDPVAYSWHHYAVREIRVDAYCQCNGQGDGSDCSYNKTLGDNQCTCQTGACGIDCSVCCPAYNQYPWQKGGRGPLVADKDAACQPCNCHNHSSVCVYNETVAKMNMSLDIEGNRSGGGVCQNCQHNTEGINCEKCVDFYYRPRNRSQWERNACQECNCSVAGTRNVSLPRMLYLDCLKDENTDPPHSGMEPGDCFCKNNTMARRCDQCKPGFFNLSRENPSGCQECSCNISGTVNGSNVCEPDDGGLCPCKQNVEGAACDSCKDTYYNLQHADIYGCTECRCDIGGSQGPVCDKTSGQCLCKPHTTLLQCNSPEDQFYFPTLHFITGNASHLTSDQGNQTWTTTLDIVGGVNTSGMFILLLSYTSTSNVTVTITVYSAAQLSHVVHLDSCDEPCNVNLLAFGELTLTGSLIVNVTYKLEVSGLFLIKVVALPREFYQPTLLGNSAMDNFLENCSVIQNTMGSGTDLQEFCLSQVYSLTIDYLGQALPCGCDSIGSVNGTCEKYAGQCPCKEGVTGRTCDKCSARFYNFSSEGCSACECQGDNKVCDAVTGQCVCPPNTEGRVCDKCSSNFWGWNQTVGCQACNCSEVGSVDLQCNLTTGFCSCKAGVQGDKCTECMDGYKSFSNQGCSQCLCDGNGSLSDVCNKSTGQCPCKNNAVGQLCDRCQSGFFYLTNTNPDGCTGCICMGISKNCSSTTSYRKQRDVELDVWSLGTAETTDSVSASQVATLDEHGGSVKMVGANISSNQTYYWRANSNLTDLSLVEAYGGNFSFKLYFTELANGTLKVLPPKVILQGIKNISIEQTLASVSSGDVTLRQLVLTEMYWVHSDDHSAVSREEFLVVLARLQALLITASYYTHGDGHYQTSLGAVQIASVGASPSQAAPRANDVEQCQCGPGYSGLSCERCAGGHHRVNVSSDQYLGKCIPCDCNGHSLDCDPATGQCLNCDHNTTGFHCELCLDGFYGNASVGTPGDCKTCPCEGPRTLTSLCEADSTGQPRCLNCSEGYEGNICGSCVVGFFGEPLNPGGNCSRCQCSNNSDVCNTTTGECLHCQYNTTGFNCERCENGTWGNATQQQCQACACDEVGAHHNICNHRTGECECKPFIAGVNCSSCEPYSYNFSSSGCTPCGCNRFGSRLLQCNDSGICECNNNTLGDKCDVCEWGFFGLPNSTCQECGCNTTGANNFSRCDRMSGQCDCKPGVTSRSCDRCMIQHTNFSGSGCDPCPRCSRLGLQGDLNAISTVLRKAQEDADTVSNLELLWPELTKVENLILQTKDSAEEFDRLVGSLQHNITQLKESTPNKTVATLQVLLLSISAESEHLGNQLSREMTRIQRLHNNTQAAKSNLTATSTSVTEILRQLENLKQHTESLQQGLYLLPSTSFDDEKQQVEEKVVRVQSVDSLAVTARYNVSTHSNMSADLNNSALTAETNLLALERELSELKQRIAAVTNVSNEAMSLVILTKSLISNGKDLTSYAVALLQGVSGIVNTTAERISYGQQSYENASHYLYGSDDRSGLTRQVNALENSITDVMTDLSAANNSVQENATKHAANLTAEATQRQRVFNSTLSHGARAVDAIKTFDEVVQLGNKSLETSRQANKSLQEIMKRLENITLVSSHLDTRVGASKNESQDLLTQTLNRDIDLQGLSSNVTASNQTFMRAVSVGLTVNDQFGVLVSRRDSLVQVAESGTNQPSYLLHTEEANGWSAEANVRSNPVNNGARVLIDQVNRLEQKVLFINRSAEEAGILLPQAFDMVQNASVSLGTVQSSVSEAENLRNITANLQEEIRRNMSALEDKLQRAKQFVAKIRLALNVQGSSAVQYRPVARMVNKTDFTEISVDFRATRVRGSLFYLSEGSSMLDRSVSVTLEHEAYVRFRYNLGSGPVDIINWQVKVRPGRWYTALATRYLSNGRLTVTDHRTNFSRTYESDSDLINRYLHTDFAYSDRLYVGGLPDGHMVNKSDRFFDGCIDNVVLNQQTLELWNPVKVEGNRSFCSRRPSSEAPLSPGTSFFGVPSGHVEQKMGNFNITGYSEMEFEFRTFQETSLLTSVLNEQSYVYGVYLNSSRVVFHFKAGNRSYTVQTNASSYTNGRWYRVRVIRELTNASLTVRPVGPTDSGAVDHNTILIPGPLFLAGGLSILFGGQDPNSPINAPVSISFAGDMRLINISTSSPGTLVRRILNSANLTEAFDGVDFSGTLSEVEKGIRFLGGGYAAVDTEQDSISELLITFKTLSPSGLLVYSGQGPYFYLSLFHGNIYMIYALNLTTFQPLMSSQETLNDGAYHTVRIEASPFGTQVSLDNKFLSGPHLATGPIPLNGSLFIGGVDNTVTLSRVLPVILPFKGDLRDIQINGAAVNIFSGHSERVSKAGVSLAHYVPPTELPTTPPPTLPPPTCGTPYPPLRNSSAVDGARMELTGSYIAFSPAAELFNYIKRRFVIVMRFRSLVPNGVVLYAADDLQKPAHFVSVELVNGRVVCKYNANSTTVTVSSTFSNYSDGGMEYEITLLRIDQFGALLISNKDYDNKRRGKNTPDLIIKGPFYYGGVPPGTNVSVLEGKGVGFIGCLRSFRIDYSVPNKTEAESTILNPRTDADIQQSSYRYKPCYQEVQSQAGFHGNGHILLDENYTLPDETEIKISFRSTTRSGLLISITSSSASVTLEQVMGQVVLTFNAEQNSSSSFVRWTDPSILQDGQYNASFHLCDNNFHQVRLRRNILTVELIVDDHAAVTAAIPPHFSLKRGKFYVGGVPEGSGDLAHSGLSRKGLTGCVQSLIIEGQAQDIVRNTQLNNVQVGCNAPRSS